MVVNGAVGRDFPRSYAQMRAWFDEDWKCRDYLDWLRWPEGFVCPHCAGVVGWRLADSRWKCGGCDRKVSAMAGTIFDKTRTPLTVWFATAWRMIGDKVGVSATQVRRGMELGVNPDGVDDVAPLPLGDGAVWPRPAARRRGGRRVLPWWPRAGHTGSRGARESAVRGRRRAESRSLRPGPARHHPGRQRGHASPRSFKPIPGLAATSSPTAGRPTRRPPVTGTSIPAPRWLPPAWPHTKYCQRSTGCSPW